MIYMTEYAVIGSRCTGTYAVNATSKREANSIVKKIDGDYARIKSYTKEELGEEDWGFIMEDVPELGVGEYYQIECGT